MDDKNKTIRECNLGVMLSEFANPNIVRVLAKGGYEFIIIDDEHGYFDLSQVAAIVALAESRGIPIMVRIPGVTRDYITKILDMGAEGILVPMVNTPEQAKEIVRYAKYAPLGKRGVSTTRAHTDYDPPALEEYFREANKRTLIAVQFETQEAISNLEEIASVEGIDALFIGPNDLACDMGIPGKVADPKILDAVAKVTEYGNRLGKPTGIITSNTKLIEGCIERGVQFFSYGSELDLLKAAAKERTRKFRELYDNKEEH